MAKEGVQLLLETIESVVLEFDDVDNVYALTGGREIQILIRNEDYSQANMRQLITLITARLREEGLLHQPTTIRMIREDEIVENLA